MSVKAGSIYLMNSKESESETKQSLRFSDIHTK